MGPVYQFRQRFDQFFFRQNHQTEFLVFFRVSVGIVILMHFCSTILDFDVLFSSNSIVPQDIMSAFTPDWVITLSAITQFFERLGLAESYTLLIFQCLFVIACVCIILGFYARISSILLLILQIALTKGGS